MLFMSSSCCFDRASNVEIGDECQIFVIGIFFNCSQVLQFGAHSRCIKDALTQKRSFLVIWTVVPRSYATPNYAIFASMLFLIGSKNLKLSYFLLFPPSYAIFSLMLDWPKKNLYESKRLEIVSPKVWSRFFSTQYEYF